MAQRVVGYLMVAALAVCVCTTACGKKGAAGFEERCERLGKACGDTAKHIENMIDECKQAGKKRVENGCTDKVAAVFECYEKELCGKADKVWTIADLNVLAERHGKCVAEREAVRACAAK